MDNGTPPRSAKPATSARIYDYFLGGVHHFPADQDAARTVIAQYPFLPAAARANRAFLGRAVRTLIDAGIRQFLDIGSGIPTVGNVHEVAQELLPQARVMYVDLDPVAVADSQELLAGNPYAGAILGDLREPAAVLAHPQVRRLIDFTEPVGLLLVAVLHFIPEDDLAGQVVDELVAALPAGSYLVVSHSAAESFLVGAAPNDDVYRRTTATPGTVRTRQEVAGFLTGLEPLPPGVVYAHEWRPGTDTAPEFPAGTVGGGMWAGVGRKA